MNQVFKKFIAYILLSLFISAITPDVFIHAFAHHDDDVDFYSACSSFSHQHTHCDHLLDEMPASQLADVIHLPAVPVSNFIQEIISPESVHLIFVEVLSLRGPPSLV